MCEVWLSWLCLEARRVIRSNGPRDPLRGCSISISINNSHDHEKHGQVCVCVCVRVCVCVCTQLLQSCPSLCGPMDSSPPVSSVHGILQARIQSELPCSPPGHLPNPGIKRTPVMSPALAGRFFTTSATWEAQANLTE